MERRGSLREHGQKYCTSSLPQSGAPSVFYPDLHHLEQMKIEFRHQKSPNDYGPFPQLANPELRGEI